MSVKEFAVDDGTPERTMRIGTQDIGGAE